ncbi:hypothetical protein ACFY5H_21455 [Streptomyces sp. NPDC013012]|uniref:hypothetical protein n=1 Tax=Streptomyces sp. NPDC013012 TaxID=3364860 RepID=UPI0036952B4A
MGDVERPELLPDCDVPARFRQPDDVVQTCLVRLADDSLGENWRTSSLQACEIRGGAAMAAASFMVKTPGPWNEDLQHVLRLSGVGVDRPSYSSAEYVVGLCYVAGTKGLPTGIRHRAADALVERGRDAGYAEARYLLPRNGWGWLADAVREGWAVWTASLFAEDENAPMKTRMRVGLALAEYEYPGSYVPSAVEQLVADPAAASADRLALAVAVAQRAPKEAVSLLCCVASDPLIQAGHRMQAIRELDEIDIVAAEKMRASQTRLPTVQVARNRQREAAERAQQEAEAQRVRETPEAVVGRLESEVEEILGDLRSRGSAGWLADNLDNHLAESDWEGVSQDVADICGLVRDEDVESALRLLEVLTRVRYGGEVDQAPDEAPSNAAPGQDFPTLSRQELEEYARTEAERSWSFWKGLVEKHGWDDDPSGELDHQLHEVDQRVGEAICQKAGDHLRELWNHLVWELWPAFMAAAEERDYGAAREHLATARLLADEVQHAQTLWQDTSAESYSFDPMTMLWPRDFWLVMEDWRRGTARR